MESRASARGEAQQARSFTELARRAQIVDEAVRLIAEAGYSKASLGQIALRLGISKGVISYHFASKDDLIEEIIATTVAEGARFMSGYLGHAQSASEELRAYINGQVAFLQSHQSQAVALVEIYNARVADYAPYHRLFVGALQELLENGQRSGEFRPFSSHVMAITIRAAIEAVPHLLVDNPDFDFDRHADELVEIFDAATRPEG